MMRTSLICLAGLAMLVASPSLAAESETPIRVLVTYGGHGFQEKEFWAMFDALPGVRYDKARLPEEADRLAPGLEKDFDVIVRYDMVRALSPEQEQAFKQLLERGIGLVALHHSFSGQPESALWHEIVGGRYLYKAAEVEGKKYGPSSFHHDMDINVTVADREHPITRGLDDFQIHDETYKDTYIAPDVAVLLTTDHPKADGKLAWTKSYGNSRVFYLMLGHDARAWQNPAYPKLLIQGIRWAAKR